MMKTRQTKLIGSFPPWMESQYPPLDDQRKIKEITWFLNDTSRIINDKTKTGLPLWWDRLPKSKEELEQSTGLTLPDSIQSLIQSYQTNLKRRCKVLEPSSDSLKEGKRTKLLQHIKEEQNRSIRNMEETGQHLQIFP